MKIAILLEDDYQVLEAWYPYFRLREEGIETVFVGCGEEQEYLSKEGYSAVEEISINNIDASDFDGVVIPGGYAPDHLRRSGEVTSFVKKLFEQQKLVAAICHAGWVLVSAGILKGKKATCFSGIKDDIINAGAEYKDKEVVVDGNLITSRNPYDLPAFSKALIKFLKNK
ncbi:MAG: type 1 glutamine amidotransferase domain-containing protein [Chlamydiota bacterium]